MTRRRWRRARRFLHLLPQQRDLELHLLPQREVVKIPTPRVPHRTAALPRQREQRRDERLLHRREREPARDARDLARQRRGELDLRAVARQLPAPELAVLRPLAEVRQGEEIAAVEAARALQALVELVEVVRRRDREDPVVVLQAVDLVEEVAELVGRDLRVDVFDDEQAWRDGAREGEDRSDRVGVGDGLDVQQRDGFGPLFLVRDERVHQGAEGDRFPVAWRAVEDDAAFPWDVEVAVAAALVRSCLEMVCCGHCEQREVCARGREERE